MKLLAYVLIVYTLLLAVQATKQQISGRAMVLSPGRSILWNVALRDEDPVNFRNLMTYQWISAFLPGSAGLFLLYLIRRSEELDPFSPRFKGKRAIEELEKHLDNKKIANNAMHQNTYPRHASCWLAALAGRNRATGRRR